MRGTLPAFPGLEGGEVEGAECRLVPCCGPAATWELLAPQSLPNSWPQTSLLQCQGWERDGACFLEKPTGGRPVSREVLLTVTFPLQGCPVLPQTPGSSVACSRSRAVPRLRLHLARRTRCSFCWCRDVFSSCQHFYLLICQPRASPCFCLFKLQARNADLEYRCLLLHDSSSPVLVHIQASGPPVFSSFPLAPIPFP